jgi:phosphoenolpyruvate carboxykinase (ATP)
MKLGYTRAMVKHALAGRLDSARFETDPVFGLSVPAEVPGVPAELMRPRSTWADGAAYDAQARKLAEMFRKNFEKFADSASPAVAQAGPRG